MRENLLACIYSATGNHALSKQYVRSLKTIVSYDYPLQWPTLFNQAMTFLTSADDVKSMETGLIAVRVICNKFEYNNTEQTRVELFEALGNAMEPMGNIVNSIMG